MSEEYGSDRETPVGTPVVRADPEITGERAAEAIGFDPDDTVAGRRQPVVGRHLERARVLGADVVVSPCVDDLSHGWAWRTDGQVDIGSPPPKSAAPVAVPSISAGPMPRLFIYVVESVGTTHTGVSSGMTAVFTRFTTEVFI